MAPSTPVTPKPSAVSSRLLSMKFMQRAAATDPGPSSAESSGTKRRKLAHHASPTPAGDDDLFSQAHIRAAMEDTESKRAAAVERRAAELDEARWVIDVPAVGGAERRKPLNVVYVGYGDIDRGEQEGAGDGEAADRVQSGRMATGNYKRKEDREKEEKERKQKENKSSGSDGDSDEEGETSDSDSDGTPRRSRSGASAETLRRDAAQDRRKREVKLSRLVSISSGGNTTQTGGGAGASARSMKCYGCGGVGHKASSSECPKNRGGGRKRRGGD